MLTFLRVCGRELGHILKHPRIWIILFAVPIACTLLFGAIFGEGVFSNLRLGIVDYSPSSESRELINAFNQSPYFEIAGYYETEEAAVSELSRSQIEAVLVIPVDYSRNLRRGRGTEVLLGANTTNMGIGSTVMSRGSEIIATVSTQIAVTRLVAQGETVEQATAEMMPVSFHIRSWYNPATNFSHFLLLGYVVAVVQQVAIYFAATALVRERREGDWGAFINRHRWPAAVILGKFFPYFSLAMISWALCYGICSFGFATPMVGSWLVWLAFSALFFAAMVAVGLLISSFAPNSLTATSLAMVITLPAYVLGGFTWPQIAMTPFFRLLLHVFPLSYFCIPLRNIALTGTGFDGLGGNMLVLGGITVVCLILAMVIYRLQRRKWGWKKGQEDKTSAVTAVE